MSPPNEDSTLPPPDHTSDYHPNPAIAPTVTPSAPRTGPDGPAAVPGYEIVGELGRGGMGVVYRAVQSRLHRTVALKMILAAEHADPKDMVRFLAEAEAVGAIRHPHVVQVHEFGENNGRPYFAMEHLPGGSLAGRLRDGPLSSSAAGDLVRKLALGVQAAHDLGIVHRDLKPANVLFDEHGEPKVTDFGLAKRGGQGDLTRTGAVMGTPAYMSPEQARGETKFVGPGADVYALGAILYESLAGRPPFRADDTVALIMKVVEEEPPPVREFAPGVSRELELICLKCLSKDLRDRYPSAAALAEDLGLVLAGEPPRHVRTSRFDQLLGVLGRGRHAAEFARYADSFLWLAALMLCVDLVVTLAMHRVVPGEVIPAVQLFRFAAVPVMLYRSRNGRLLPTTPGERFLWSLWGGYLVACLASGLAHRMEFGWDYYLEVRLYQSFAVLTGLAFFALGSSFWGWCYAFGAAFLGLACLMALDMRFAPVMFGALWAAVLVAVAVHLRALAARAGTVTPHG